MDIDRKANNETGVGVRAHHDTKVQLGIPRHVPNLVMSSILLIGITAMGILIVKRDDLTTEEHEERMSRHEYLHRKYSLRSIIVFFVLGSILHLNYFIEELSCVEVWTRCKDVSYVITNVSELIFHYGCILFMISETAVCWIMNFRNFVSSQWVWHGMAVVQSANIAIWFDSLLQEAYHRIHGNSEYLNSYFRFCDANVMSNSHNQTLWCSESSVPAKWFLLSIPFLYPVTIEFALLVSETLLGRVAGENVGDNNAAVERPDPPPATGDPPNEGTPLLQRRVGNQNRSHLPPAYANSSASKIFILISVFINIVYSVLTILVFVGYKLSGVDYQQQAFDDVFAIYSVIYDVFSIVCCCIGIATCRHFRRPRSHTSFLEYLLLLSTAGVFLQSMKRIAGFVSYSDEPTFTAYVFCGGLDILQSFIQIVFYFYAKDIKLRLSEYGGQADSASSITVFTSILVVVSVNNAVMWLSDSFLLPDILPDITPSNGEIELWPVFDNVVTPITIFFRFNSALLFWCIGTDVFQPGDHED